MISMNPVIPDVPASLETLSNMLILLSDPEKSKARVAELAAASAALQQQTADNKAAIAAFIVAEADHKAALAQQAAEADAKLRAALSEFDAECARRKSELDDREARLTELQSAASDDAKAAAAARGEYERKLAIIKSAM
jgi:hypothetical protein